MALVCSQCHQNSYLHEELLEVTGEWVVYMNTNAHALYVHTWKRAIATLGLFPNSDGGEIGPTNLCQRGTKGAQVNWDRTEYRSQGAEFLIVIYSGIDYMEIWENVIIKNGLLGINSCLSMLSANHNYICLGMRLQLVCMYN